MQLLVDPQALGSTVPQGSRPLRADAVEDLSPVLRTVISNQPEFSAWTPSTICLYYMETVDMGSLRVSERNPRKAPMLGVWALAAADAADGARRDVVLRLFTNAGRVERAGEMNGLEVRTVRSTVGELQSEETGTAIGTRYEFKLGKTLLTWDGRRISDSTRANGPVSQEWRVEKKRGGWVTAHLVLTHEWTKSMVGSLRVEGKDDFAQAIKASPIRFVGPAVMGGGGELAFRRR